MANALRYYLKKFIRHGSAFRRFSREIKNTRFLPKEELVRLQNRKLQKIVHHCYKNVPYYTDLFRELNLKPDEIQTQEDLVKLPFMNKDTVKQNFDKLIAKNKLKFLSYTAHTSGTTGTPAKFLRDYTSINYENAFLWRFWNSAGDNGTKRISLRGDLIIPTTQSEPPFWKFNPANNELLMSAYHLSDENAGIYIEKIKEFQPEVVYTLPSIINLLASYFRKHNQKYQFKAIFTSSETFIDYQKKFVEETFNCKVFDWYGMVERVAAIAHCEHGTYHIQEDYSIVDTINTNLGTNVVGTHLHNYIMPLIKYKTGDLIKINNKSCTCGQHFRTVEEIQGRECSYITTPKGTQISLMNNVPRGVNNLIETQFVQKKIDELIINVKTNGQFTETDKAQLIKNAQDRTSPNMKIIVKELKEIPRSANGKFISVINQLDYHNLPKELEEDSV